MSGFLKVLKIILTLFAKNAKSSSQESEKKETVAAMTSNIEYKNDSNRLRQEHKELETKNPKLYIVLLDCGVFCKEKFNKNVVITMIYRTEAEQDDLYKDSEKYKVKKFKSPHQFFHAFDLRSSIFETNEKKILVDYLNTKYNISNYYKFTALCHDIDGNGPQAEHFHVNYVKK